MPELMEQMYCSQQIVIPPKFPYLLKKYAKAAIKTQPYDLLQWSFQYFKAIAEGRTPPVKLRLEYPLYSTEGGLTRGFLKVLANQLEGTDVIPLPVLKSTWLGACLDELELTRILCLAGVHIRKTDIPRLHFIAVAGGLLTKSLTHTMILLCETLTKEPDGGSAAIPVDDFLAMYSLLAGIDASRDVNYIDGYMEGQLPNPSEVEEKEAEEEMKEEASQVSSEVRSADDYWPEEGRRELVLVELIDDSVPRSAHISQRLALPLVGGIERCPSVERAGRIEREAVLRERWKRIGPDRSVEDKLRELSGTHLSDSQDPEEKPKKEAVEVATVEKPCSILEVHVFDEEDTELPLEFYGEPEVIVKEDEDAMADLNIFTDVEEEAPPEEVVVSEKEIIAEYVAKSYEERTERLADLVDTFAQIAALVDRYKSAYYDLSMVAGRQMSTTSGEFVVSSIERDIMDYVNEQIAVLPDPDLKKKKAKPEEVAMIRQMLESFLDDNMDLIVPELEEAEEEETPIPDIIIVYEVPGIGPIVEEEITYQFTDYAIEVSKTQAGLFMPRNIRHFLCPPLEKYVEIRQERVKEEVPTAGVLTD